jgi:PKD repeat protein
MINKTFLMMVVALFTASFLSAQQGIDLQNTREGESVEYCREHKHLVELLKNPEFKKQWDKDQATLQAEENLAKSKLNVTAKGIVYRIPVVFHVLHNNGVENISREQIDDALYILNRDYRLMNADANNVYAPFAGTAADIEVEFVYATIAPNGQCFNGITRTVSPLTNEGDDGVDQVNAIVAGNDVYNGQWPGNKYLNIFVCKDIGGAAGYTYRPSNFIGTNMRNGIWVLQNYVGSIGTGAENRSRTLTHEVGHWLNLPHVWGGTNNPGLASNCDTGPNDDDGVDDTPECIGNTSCQLNANTCSLDNAYWGFDQVDPVENYMNYSYCTKMFSQGQAIKMRTALNSTTGGRNNIHTTANLIATGADSNLVICKVDFSASTEYVCPGEPVNFYDLSFNNIKGWNWSFPGATPSTASVKNPVVTYNTPGTYTVTLTATDSVNNITSTKTNYITVMPNGVSLPYSESFESYSSLNNSSSFWRTTGSGSTAFEVTNTAGSEGSKSLKLRNFVNAEDTYTELYSNPFDLSAIPSSETVTFSFKYAHRKKNISDYEIFRFHASNDCGETWSIRKTLLSSSLSTQDVSSEWTPSINDWVQVHIININSLFYVNNAQFKFSFESDEGNNLFIDEINLYQGGPESLGLNELGELENVLLFPNPADEELNVQFTVQNNSDVNLIVQDITGKSIRTEVIKASAGKNLVMMNTADLATGMYFMNIVQGESKKTVQFVVK